MRLKKLAQSHQFGRLNKIILLLLGRVKVVYFGIDIILWMFYHGLNESVIERREE
jgi:hypothetical protein